MASGLRFLKTPVSSLLVLAGWVSLSVTAATASEKVLYSFQGGSDGRSPNGPLITDAAGNLYGVTGHGGNGGCGRGCGTVFKIAPDGAETILYAFKSGNDAAVPNGALLLDGSGNLYGTAGSSSGNGAIFKLAPDGTESIFYAFQGGSDGYNPQGGVISDANGNLYGMTLGGGNMADCNGNGCGTVFELLPDGTKTILFAFHGSDGWAPQGGLAMDRSGNLYGATAIGGNIGGCDGNGCGTVFKVSSDGTEAVLYVFKGGNDGYSPVSGVILDSVANLYGTTPNGGAAGGCCGTVFKVASDGTETVLHVFQNTGLDGQDPESGLIMDNVGALYGTTYYGGDTCFHGGCGTVFKVAPSGEERVLYSFNWGHGAHPAAALLPGANGLLYGTTTGGGNENFGAVFKLKK